MSANLLSLTQPDACEKIERFVDEEIKVALYLYKLQYGTPKGLILGLEKYRKLAEGTQLSQEMAEALQQTHGLSIMVDASQPRRVAFF